MNLVYMISVAIWYKYHTSVFAVYNYIYSTGDVTFSCILIATENFYIINILNLNLRTL